MATLTHGRHRARRPVHGRHRAPDGRLLELAADAVFVLAGFALGLAVFAATIMIGMAS